MFDAFHPPFAPCSPGLRVLFLKSGAYPHLLYHRQSFPFHLTALPLFPSAVLHPQQIHTHSQTNKWIRSSLMYTERTTETLTKKKKNEIIRRRGGEEGTLRDCDNRRRIVVLATEHFRRRGGCLWECDPSCWDFIDTILLSQREPSKHCSHARLPHAFWHAAPSTCFLPCFF